MPLSLHRWQTAQDISYVNVQALFKSLSCRGGTPPTQTCSEEGNALVALEPVSQPEAHHKSQINGKTPNAEHCLE